VAFDLPVFQTVSVKLVDDLNDMREATAVGLSYNGIREFEVLISSADILTSHHLHRA